MIKPEDIPDDFAKYVCRLADISPKYGNGVVAAILNAAIEAGVVSPPCHFIAYPSGMPVMHEPGESIQIYPGKCSEPHHRHWKGQTE